MRVPSTRTLSVALGLLAWVSPALAAVYTPITDVELLRRSDVVVVGKSLGPISAGLPGETWTRFEMTGSVSGVLPPSFVVAVPGGPLGNGLTLAVPDVPVFAEGGRYLLFLSARADGSYVVTEHLLGAFDVLTVDSNTYVTRTAFLGMKGPGPFRSSNSSASSVAARGSSDVVRDLAEFVTWIRKGPAAEATYFRSVDLAALATKAGGPSPLWNSKWNGTQARWSPSATGTVFASNTLPAITGQSGVAGTGGGLNYEFKNAISWWVADPFSDIFYTRGTDRNGGFDPANLPNAGEVVVYLNDTSMFGGKPGSPCGPEFSGTLAVGGWLTDQTTHSYKGTTWSTIRGGIGWVRAMSDEKGMCPAGTIPSNVFENALTAVLGNTLGLSTNPQTASVFDVYTGDEIYAVMNAVQDSNRGTGLGSDDFDAICYVYGSCDPGIPPSAGPTSGFTLFPTPAVKGGNTSFRDLSGGQATAWNWEWREMAGGTGASAGTSTNRNPVFVFPKVGFYQARLTVTNVKGSSVSTGPVEVRTNLTGTFTPPSSTQAGVPASLGLTFIGKADKALFSWGDGQTTTVANPVSPLTASHTYAAPGVYYSAVQLTDADRTADATPTQWLKVFDMPTGFTVYQGPCGTPSAPVVKAPAFADPNRGLLLTWGAPSDYQAITDRYVIEVANNPAFSGDAYWQYTSVVPLLIVPPDSPARGNPGQTIYARVHVERQCGSTIQGGTSGVTQTVLRQPAPAVTTTPQRLYLSYFPGTTAPSLTLTFLAGYFTFANANVTLTAPSFVNLSASSLLLAPEATRDVAVTFPAATLAKAGVYSGSIKVAYEQDTFYVPVTLVVQAGGPYTSAPAGPPATATVTIPNRPDPLLKFSAPSGQTPAPGSVTVQISPVPAAQDQWFLDLSDLPGWLDVAAACGGGENDTNCALFRFPASGKLDLSLWVNRANRSSSHRTSPQYFAGILSAARSVGDTRTGLPMIDMEGVTVKQNAAADLAGGVALVAGEGQAAVAATAVVPPSDGSFVVPTVSQGGGLFNSRFASDGWIKNASSDPISVSLYFTPEGVSGTTDPGVTKASWPIQPGQAFRLARLMDSFFAHGDGTGRMEVRSSMPQAVVLQARTEAQSQGDPLKRFGTDIPIPLWGRGLVAGGAEFLMPGIVQNAQKRTNLILAETFGQPATADVTVRDENGTVLGTVLGVAVPPYGKIQLNQVVLTAAPTASLTNGSLSVRVNSGTGRVFPLATVIDDVANSFYAVQGKLMALAGAPSGIVIPMAVRTTGLFDTYFSTSIFIANNADDPAILTLTYHYTDQDAADLSRKGFTSVVIPAKGCLPLAKASDALATLFGLVGRTYGWIEVRGDVAKVAISSGLNAQIDPNDATKGVRSAQVPAIDINTEFAFEITSDAHHAMGLERSEQKRTNLILVNINAQPSCQVRLLLMDAEGKVLGRKEVVVGIEQYLQINDVFGPTGFNLPPGDYRDMILEATIVCGNGRVLGFLTVNDNISRNPEVVTLRPAGPTPLF